MNDIKVGSKWIGKSCDDVDCTIVGVMDNEVKVECEARGNWFYYPIHDFLSMYKPKLSSSKVNQKEKTLMDWVKI